MEAFNPAEWLGKHKTYNARLPRFVRRAATSALSIPEVVQQELSKHQSLQGLITFQLPIAQEAPPPFADLVTKFFSLEPPSGSNTLLLTQLRRLPIPNEKTVNILYDAARQAWLDGAQSLSYAHLSGDGATTTRFPLGVISWWKEVTKRREPRCRLLRASAYVQKQLGQSNHPEREIAAQEALSYMARLPWNISQDLSDDQPTHRLSRLLGQHFLSTSQVNNKILLLAERAFAEAGERCMVRFEPVEVTNYLLRAYEERDDPETVLNSLLSGIRDSMMEGVLVLTVANLEKVDGLPHWVPVGVNGEQAELLYGDSLGEDISPTLEKAWKWLWSTRSDRSLTTKYLDITLQKDGYNCGLLATNSLEHYVFNTPLAGSNVRELAMRRLQDFSECAERILAKIEYPDEDGCGVGSDTESELSVTDGEYEDVPVENGLGFPSGEFTFRFPVNSQTKEDVPATAAVCSDSSTASGESVLKRSRDHPNVPTPNPSPQKKRTHVEADETIPLPSFNPSVESSVNESDSSIGAAKNVVPQIKNTAPVLKTASITDFFKQETPEERAARNQRNAEQAAADRSTVRAREDAARLRKEEKKREDARLRKAKSRGLKREQKVAEGWVPYAGRKRKRELHAFDDSTDSSSATDDHSVAELSRPHRQFKEDARAHNKSCGRKRQKVKEDAVRTNWLHPLLWSQIEDAAKRAGKPWRPSEILRELKRSNAKQFARLSEQAIGRWIDKDAKRRGESAWRQSILDRVKKGNRPGGETRRTGILHQYPDLCAAINKRLYSLRENGVVLTLTSIRAIMVSYINIHAPHLFKLKQSDGTLFRCSESYARKYLRNVLGWSERRATKAAKKVPENVDEILKEAFLREAYIIRDHAMPGELRVNTDQTQIVYQQGTKTTWNERGAKQVPVAGHEEKRAFTLVPSISASGDVLPMQAIYHGKTDASCPSPKSALYEDAKDLGIRFLPSKSDTYWSTHETMHDLVDNIIAPYFDAKKKELGLDASQCSLWKIDCWSVHKSKEFLEWMKARHPNIIVLFIPGNCTSLWQPLDVGIQRVMKLSIKRASHRDVVTEISDQLDEDPDTSATLDMSIKTLRNRSVGWLVNCIRDISDREFVQKAFELCVVGELNCSQACLTAPSTLAMLRRLHETHPTLHAELIKGNLSNKGSKDDVEEDIFDDDDDDGADDSDIPLHVLADALAGDVPSGFVVNSNGMVERAGIAEGDDDEATQGEADDLEDVEEQEPALELPKVTRSGRVVKPSTWYSGAVWDRS